MIFSSFMQSFTLLHKKGSVFRNGRCSSCRVGARVKAASR